jgi:hypothetical protein
LNTIANTAERKNRNQIKPIIIMSGRFLTLLAFVAFASAVSCGKKDHKDEHAATSPKEWKEMDDFHMVMAEAFHPYKDSADLAPAKRIAGEMASAAKEWKSADKPEGINAAKFDEKLERLATLTEEFANLVKSESDEVVAGKLTGLHDLFHDLQNDFYAGAHEHHDGEDHHH